MKTNNELSFIQPKDLRIFHSEATPRKNNLRIHYHTMIELSLILRGRGLYRIGENVLEIKPNDVFFFRPNEAHCITDIHEGGMLLLNLHISPLYLYSNLQNALRSDYIKILSANYPLKSNKLNDSIPEAELEKIRHLLKESFEEYEAKKSDHLTLINNHISTAFIYLARLCADKTDRPMQTQNYQRIIASMAYIDENFKEDITLESLASQSGYSRCYFSSIFKQCLGMSVWDYICIKRVEQALSLIKTTDKSILQIATSCGFNNTVNFNKIFKKYTNLSPSSFRK